MAAAEIIGTKIAEQVERLSIKIYEKANDYAAQRGIIIADTKFEFGLDESTNPPTVILIDEVLTPDSSRFWRVDRYEAGRAQDSFDKQYLRGMGHLMRIPRSETFNLHPRLAAHDQPKRQTWSRDVKRGRC